MAIAFVTPVTTDTVADGLDRTDQAFPDSPAEGDYYFLAAICDNSGTGPKFVSELGQGGEADYTYLLNSDTDSTTLRVQRRLLGSGTPTTYDYRAYGTRDQGILVAKVTGVDTTTPEDGVTPSFNLNNLTPPSLTSNTDGAMSIVGFVIDNEDSADEAASISPPSGYTQLVIFDTGQGSTSSGATMVVAYQTIASAGTVTPGAWTWYETPGNNYKTFHVILKPAAGGGSDVDVDAAAESLTLTTQQATVSVDVDVSAAAEALTLTTQPATIAYGVNVGVNTEALTVTPLQASISVDVNVSVASEALTVTTYPASLGQDANVSASTEALTLTTFPANVGKDIAVTAGQEALTLTTQPATVDVSVNISANTEQLEVTAYSATVSNDIAIPVASEALSLTTYGATVSYALANINVEAVTEQLVIRSYQATIVGGFYLPEDWVRAPQRTLTVQQEPRIATVTIKPRTITA